jgi:predicted transcriptional regulator
MDTHEKTELLNLTTKIVTAYATKNPVAVADLRDLIAGVSHGLATVGTEGVTPKLEPAVPIKKSVTRAHIVCLEDGLKHKLMKRHLKTAHQMIPDEYRAKWGLAANYPMTAPDYSVQRSKLAKKSGLGTNAVSRLRKPKR